MSAVFALLASLVWGSSDYLGGSAARRMSVAWVIFLGQACALVLLLVGVTALGLWRLDDAIAWGAAAGMVGPVALGSFYTALSTGTMGVVAPVASCGVMVPVVVGVAEGEQPGGLQVVGIVLTVVGVVFAGRSSAGAIAHSDGAVARSDGAGIPGDQGRANAGSAIQARRAVLLALVAAIGFGVVLICVAEGSRGSTGTTLTVQRLVSVALVGGVLLIRRPALSVQPADKLRVLGSGLGDAGANALYAQAVTGGLVSVNAVLSSLYPVVTALLARRIDDERLSRAQAAGVSTALVGVLLLAAG